MSAPKESNGRALTRKSVRLRPLPPEVMARNLAIEKKRREALNEKFLVLARSIPGLDTTQRLTKVLIVDESIQELERQRNLYIAAMQNIQDLIAENERLSIEINNLRSQTLNFCACSGKTGISADTRLQLTEFHTGIEDNWLREIGDMYDSTKSSNANLVGTSGQSGHCPNTAEQCLQPFVQNRSLQGGFGVQSYQTPSIFDRTALSSHLEVCISDGYTIGDCPYGSSSID